MIKLFEDYNEIQRIRKVCLDLGIRDYTINSDNTIDVHGNVHLYSYAHNDLSKYKTGKLPLKFNKISGNLICSDFKLTTLEGCPIEVGGNFHCGGNKLSTLEGGPEYVELSLNCDNNELTNLIGSPKIVNESFFCMRNKLTSLEGCPEKADHFYCSINTSLYFSKYFPECRHFACVGTPLEEIYKLFPNYESFKDSLDYNYFRGDNKINKIRLTQALLELDLKCPENLKGYIWE